MPLSETTKNWKMPFGKYRGQTIDETASTVEGLLYLDWLVGQDWLRGRFKDALEEYLFDESIAREVEAAVAAHPRSTNGRRNSPV